MACSDMGPESAIGLEWGPERGEDSDPAGVIQLVPDLRQGGGLADLAAQLLSGAPLLDADAFRRQPPEIGTLLVHYSGYGYAPQGAPAQLVRELLAWRQQRPGRRLLLWVHELYARQPPWRKGFWWAPQQRRVVRQLAAGADGLVTNLERHARWLRARQLPPLAVFPVPSNVGEPHEPRPLADREPRLVVFGGTAQRLAAYRALERLGPWLGQLGLEAIDDIGAPLPQPPRTPLPVQEHGRLPAAAVSQRLGRCRAAAVSYPLDFVAKSGIFAAIAAHGCLPLLLGSGRRSGPCDGLRRGEQLLCPGPSQRPDPSQPELREKSQAEPRHGRATPSSTQPQPPEQSGLEPLRSPGLPSSPPATSALEAIAAAAWSWYQPHRLSVQRRWLRAWLAGDADGEIRSVAAVSAEAEGPLDVPPALPGLSGAQRPSPPDSAPWPAPSPTAQPAGEPSQRPGRQSSPQRHPTPPLRLLLYCHAYLPSLGGLERAGQLLAEQLSAPSGESGLPAFRIDLVTATPADDPAWDQRQPYRLWRRPSLATRLRLVARAEVVHSNGASLAVSLLAVLLGKPLLITHQGYQLVSVDGLGWGETGPTPLTPAASLAWYRRRLPWPAWIRQVLLLRLRRWVAHRAAANVAISAWVDWRQPLPRRRLIPNPVALQPLPETPDAPAAATSRQPGLLLVASHPPGNGTPGPAETLEAGGPGSSLQAWSQRPWELVFLGRLVQEKGLDVLLRALPRLQAGTGLRPRLRVIGDGPMGPAWRALAQELGLAEQVRFEGSLHGEPLVRALAEGRIGVVPSVWEEPMGMVAAEFLAAGVVPVVSQRGGLAEVVGPAGLTFANGDSEALAGQLARLLAPAAPSSPQPGRSARREGRDPASLAGRAAALAEQPSGTHPTGRSGQAGGQHSPEQGGPLLEQRPGGAGRPLELEHDGAPSGPPLVEALLGRAPAQLRLFNPARIAARYADLYASVARRRGP